MYKKFSSLSALAFTTLTLLCTGCPDTEEPSPDAAQPTSPDAGTPPGPTPPEFQACAADVDNGMDRVLDDRWTYFYDDRSFPTKDELDTGRDGTIDQRDEWAFDDRGHMVGLVQKGIAADGTATPFYQQKDAYNSKDLLVERLVRIDLGDGNPPFVRLTKFRYDAEGKLIERTLDRDADKTIDARTTFTFDSRGLHLESQTDSGLDGTIDSVTYYTWDATGEITKQEFDTNNDGTIDRVYSYRYDSEGRYLGTVETQPADPAFEISRLATFDAQGRRTSDTATFSDDPGSNIQFTYLYDCASGARHARQMLQVAKVRSEAQLLRLQVREGRVIE